MKNIVDSWITFLIAIVGLIGGFIWAYSTNWDFEPIILTIISAIGIVGFFILKNLDDGNKVNDLETNLSKILSRYIGKDFYIYSNEHAEFGFRIFGNFDKLLNIEILFKYTDGLHYVNEGVLEDIFYPLLDFGERIEITNEIRKDQLGIRLKCHYLNAPDKSEIFEITKKVILDSFYKFAKIPNDSFLVAEVYNRQRHPTKPEWTWQYDWKP